MRTASQYRQPSTAHSLFYHRRSANATVRMQAARRDLPILSWGCQLRHYFFLAVMLAVGGCGGSEGSTEDALRAWVSSGEQAAEDKDRGKLVDMISPDYVDARGNDRKRLGDILRLYFLRQNNIALLTSIDSIDVSGDSAATVALTVGMAGTKDSVLGFNADAYRFEFDLLKPDDEWLLVSARWGDLGSQLH